MRYYSISNLPSLVWGKLQEIKSQHNIDPFDPPSNGYTWVMSRYAVNVANLYYFTGDNHMYELYDSYLDYVYMHYSNDHYYLSNGGPYSPTGANHQRIAHIILLYEVLDDNRLYEIGENTTKGFAGLRSSYNWPYTTTGSYTVPANTLSGEFWGTFNQDATIMAALAAAYYSENMSCYGHSGVEEKIWNIAMWLKDHQVSDGYFYRDYGHIYNELYDFVTVFYCSLTYMILDVYGDIVYNGDSIKGILKDIIDKHYEFVNKKFGPVRTIVTGIDYAGLVYTSFILEYLVHNNFEEGDIIRSYLVSPVVWSDYYPDISSNINYYNNEYHRRWVFEAAGFEPIPMYMRKLRDIFGRWV